jgi:hypothetical protein
VGRRLLLLADGLLLVLVAALAGWLYDAWTATPPPTPPESAVARGPVEPGPPPEAAGPRPALSAYAVVAERNLFSPTRSEVGPEPPRAATARATAAPPAPRPRLFGVVVLPDGKGRAYLEDVARRRVFAYGVGDAVGDARLEQIKPDRVVLRRGAETFEVLLRDPTKPRPPPAPAGVQSPQGQRARPEGARPPASALTPGSSGVRPPIRARPPGVPPAPPQAPSEEGQASSEGESEDEE